MDLRALTLFVGFCSSVSPAEVRLVGGPSPCSGRVEQKHQSLWEPVRDHDRPWNLTAADQVCRRMSCGSVVSLRRTLDQERAGDSRLEGSPEPPPFRLEMTCSDSVRLENETHLCSGRLQVKWNQVWSSVCSDGFDLQDAEVVCRELGCGSPSGFKEELYGGGPEWSPEFRCGGHESVLLHCERSDRDTCSPGTTVTLTCSDPGRVRLVGGSGRCDGTLEVRSWGEWRPVDSLTWDLRSASRMCKELDCGYSVSTRRRETGSIDTWRIRYASSQINHETSFAVIELTCSVSSPLVRLVGGPSPCSGRLEQQPKSDWEPVRDQNLDWNLTAADQVCRRISCGSVVSLTRTLDQEPAGDLVTRTDSRAEGSPAASVVEITCSDSVRLVGGTHLCSGRLQVRVNQVWSSVCPDGFDLQDAEVVCRELGCGSPSGFKEELHGGDPEWSPEFRCGGHESALLHCERSDRDTCSPGTTVTLTCSDPGKVRLVGGSGRCDGTVEWKYWDEWRPVDDPDWNLRSASRMCKELDCGSPVSIRRRETGSIDTWRIGYASSRIKHQTSFGVIELTCSDSVRLVRENHLCSGRLQVKWNQVWSSVCSDGFDLQDAEVVCRELGCGSPSGFKQELYEGAPEWSPEFRCGGHESALLHCERSDRDTCSPGTNVRLACSDRDDVRLVGGASRCSGRLEMKHDGVWRAVKIPDPRWNLNMAALVCRWLNCGPAVSAVNRPEYSQEDAWWVSSFCHHSSLKDCVTVNHEQISDSLEVTCSDSVRLVDGTHLCSGRLQVKWNQVWSSVCSDGFDLQDAEVVCRELGCGSPSGFKEELYGGGPEWSPEFRCGGHESALLHCERSDRDTCSPGTTVTLTCSDQVRLVGNSSTCAGELQMKIHGEWRPVVDRDWDRNQNQNWTSVAAAAAAVVCSQLGCGSVATTFLKDSGSDRLMWFIWSPCLQSAVSLLDCLVLTTTDEFSLSLQVVCSDLLVQPNISVSPSHDEVQQQKVGVLLGSNFSIICSTRPQYPGGSFQLVFTSSSTTLHYVLPAVAHWAVFLFPAAQSLHRGTYTCIYHLNVFSHNFSSSSRPIHLIPSAPLTELMIRFVVYLLVFVLLISVTCFCYRKYSVKTRSRIEETNVVVELQ